MGKTDIEWTDHSINPIKFRLRANRALVNMCTVCSEGCRNCYSQSITKRFWPKDAGTFPSYTAQALKQGEFVLDESKLKEVLRRRKPTTYFWCDMTDMFHPSVPFDLVDQCFAVMALTPHHTHQILTKRPERMAEYMSADPWDGWLRDRTRGIMLAASELVGEIPEKHSAIGACLQGPLKNVWLGTSVEDQKRRRAYPTPPEMPRCDQIPFV